MIDATPPAAPPRCRRYVDGLVSVPWDLVRDPALGCADKTIACALAALCPGPATAVAEMTRDIGRACGRSRRAVQAAIRNLIAAGWIVREPVPGKGQRRIVLLWKLPDDGAGLVPDFARRSRRPGGPLALFPAPARGGEL